MLVEMSISVWPQLAGQLAGQGLPTSRALAGQLAGQLHGDFALPYLLGYLELEALLGVCNAPNLAVNYISRRASNSKYFKSYECLKQQ